MEGDDVHVKLLGDSDASTVITRNVGLMVLLIAIVILIIALYFLLKLCIRYVACTKGLLDKIVLAIKKALFYSVILRSMTTSILKTNHFVFA